MNKPTKPNITIPESFAANGVKADFDNNKILNGFDRIQPDVLAGDNLNKFIDDTYKGLNYSMVASDALNILEDGHTLVYEDGEFKSKLVQGLDGKITNCITEKPKYLDWTYTDGVITLKAGSKLMYPDGFNSDGSRKFSYYTTTKDWIWDQTSTTASLRYLWVSRGLQYAANFNQTMLYVGDTAPTLPNNYCLWYDTANNILKDTNDKGVTWRTGNGVFPFMTILQRGEDGFAYPTSVFDGIGIMDKCAWIADGVKVLIPNGRNEDGTLNNIEVTSEARITFINWSIDTYNAPLVFYPNNTLSSAGTSYIVSEEQPSTNFTLWYNPVTNEMAYKGGSTSEWGYNNKAGVIGYYNSGYGAVYDSLSSILSVNFKEPFRAVDFNDFNSEIDTKVSKSGDTMTGNLMIDRGANQAVFSLKSSKAGLGDTPVEGSQANSIYMYKKEALSAILQNSIRTDGSNAFQIILRDPNNTNWSGLLLLVDENNNTYFDFPKCTTKATTTSTASSSKVAVITQNYKNGNSWYRVWSDGWKEQGGNIEQNTGTSGHVTFLKNFTASGVYTICLGFASSVVSHQCSINNRANDGFDWYKSYNDTAITWYACGY